jgi:hypothetical protein
MLSDSFKSSAGESCVNIRFFRLLEDFFLQRRAYIFFCNYISECRSATFQGNAESRRQRCVLFTEEKKRQGENIGRIEKIQVQYTGTPEDATLMMNKGISTPFNCAQRNNLLFCLYFYGLYLFRDHIWHINVRVLQTCQRCLCTAQHWPW